MTRWYDAAPVSRLLTTMQDDTRAACCPPVQLHRRLAAFNRKRLLPTHEEPRWPDALSQEMELRSLEARFVRDERAALGSQLTEVPSDDPRAFMDWFHALKETGPGQGDALFPWLAEHATIDQMRWFLRQEAAGEAGFDDLVALTQIRFPARPKLEMANNYWDEMGRGREAGMHGPMLERTTRALDLRPSVETTVWESLALANLMVAMAINRHLAYQSVGALGAIEMTAPGRVSRINEGMQRLGLSAEVRRYFQLHAGLDVRHSLAWNREVIEPLVAADPRAARPIAEGALLRLSAGARCFDRYRRELGLIVSAAPDVERLAAA